jgi:hypothetical protein
MAARVCAVRAVPLCGLCRYTGGAVVRCAPVFLICLGVRSAQKVTAGQTGRTNPNYQKSRRKPQSAFGCPGAEALLPEGRRGKGTASNTTS